MTGRGVAVVPLKAPSRAKSRLAAALAPAARAALVVELAEHVIATLAAAPSIAEVVVIAQDAEAAAVATRAGARAVLEDPRDHGRLGAIVDRALAQLEAPWALVVMADLPYLAAADVAALAAALAGRDAVIAPDETAAGTGALAVRLPAAWPTAFGRADSFAEHLRRCAGAAVLRSPTVAFDVDTAADLMRLRSHVTNGADSQVGRLCVTNNRFVIKVMSKMHRFFYRLTGGRIGGKLGKAPVLLLTTTGKKTGKQRTTPLIYTTHGDGFAVVASNAGDDKSPAWWVNLKAQSAGKIQVRGEKIEVSARQASPDERAALFPKLVEVYPTYADYEKRTTRAIPVVILERNDKVAN